MPRILEGGHDVLTSLTDNIAGRDGCRWSTFQGAPAGIAPRETLAGFHDDNGRASGGVSERTIEHADRPGRFFYQLVFRGHPASLCDGRAAFNTSNGYALGW